MRIKLPQENDLEAPSREEASTLPHDSIDPTPNAGAPTTLKTVEGDKGDTSALTAQSLGKEDSRES